MLKSSTLLTLALLVTTPALAGPRYVHVGRLLDPETEKVLVNQLIKVVDGRVAAIAPWTRAPGDGPVVDWSGYEVLPGLIDAHVHLADSNRLGPGFGTIDFKPILRGLQDLEYDGYLCLECAPAGPDPDGMCEQSIKYLKSMETLSAAQIKSR